MIHFDKETFDQTLSEGKLMMVDFWAEWCGPCRQMSPIVDELAKEYEGKALICKCDVETADEVAMRFKVRNIPTIVFLKGGELKDKQVGSCPKETLSGKLNALL